METNRTLDFFSSDVQQKFEWPDYLSFCIMLALSGVIGIYFGFWGKEEDSRQEYSHGGKNMSIFPITASLTVSLVSAIAILGIPSEIYMYGILFWWICLSAVIAGVLNDFFYLPVFYELRLASCYEFFKVFKNAMPKLIGMIENEPFAIRENNILDCYCGISSNSVKFNHKPAFSPEIQLSTDDRKSTFKISKPDEMIIYYVMQISAYTPGLPGLFVAGVVSAALSTLSSSLNSISLTVFEDFISPWVKNRISDTHASYIMKLIALIFGAVCLGLSFVVGKLGLIAQLGTSLNGVTTGTVLGIFSLGIFFPRANHKGALTGGIISLVVTIWLVMGAQIAIAERKINYETLPTTAVGCGYNDTTPNELESNGKEDDVFILYKLSFTYFSLTGFLLVIIIGLPVSYLTEPPKSHNLKPVLFAPIIRKYFMRTENYNLNDAKEMELMNINS